MSYSIALGPFHPAWRGPQRFVCTLDGERVADIEYHNDLNARGCAQRIPRLDIAEALHLVSRICGSCSIAHSLAFCLALEALAGLEPGARASSLRCAAAEFERAAAHLDAAGKTLRAVGMPAQARALDALVTQLRHALALLTGAPLAPSYVLPGGVARNLANAEYEQLALFLPKLNRTLLRTAEHLIDNRALLARTVEVGALPRAAAEQFGVRGPAARASGIARDVRVDKPYSAYGELAIKPIV
ncbi:MAG TPA: NADH-quinone oxidoreductase subunit D, partial [Roseiflexaceae bacterium]|nr:NADH-quinone oxidoreductase subunit D [Roseiflexaceae bacterium]